MSDINGWFTKLRSILELLYFASGIAIAIAAFWGLKQLTISKKIANTSATREAIKLAAEQCRYFGENAVPLWSKLLSEYKRLNLTFLSTPPQFQLQNGEVTNHNFDTRVLDAEVPKIGDPLVAYLNCLEAFAIPFAAGVADEALGFQETARAFCQGAQLLMPGIFYLRRTNAARYESTVKVFVLWNTRLAAQVLAPVMKTMEEVIKAAETGKIKTLGVDR
jgi:hypothetical protein